MKFFFLIKNKLISFFKVYSNLHYLTICSNFAMVRVDVQIKRLTGHKIIDRQTSTNEASRALKVNIRTVQRYAYKIKNQIPVFETSGRPRVLDYDHFNRLVDFIAELPQENLSENRLLVKKFRELSKETLIRRLRNTYGDIDEDVVVVPYSCSSRKRYCLQAIAIYHNRQASGTINTQSY
jgi:hypothetical protein